MAEGKRARRDFGARAVLITSMRITARDVAKAADHQDKPKMGGAWWW